SLVHQPRPALVAEVVRMGGVVANVRSAESRRLTGVAAEAPWVQRTLIALAVAVIVLFLVLPLVVVFSEALAKGPLAYLSSIAEDEALASIRLTLLTAAIVVPLNFSFGIAAAWLVARYDFTGKSLLITLIDLPFSVSPVISGLIFVLLFGAQGWFGPFLGQ